VGDGGTSSGRKPVAAAALLAAIAVVGLHAPRHAAAGDGPEWASPNRYRVVLTVDLRGRRCSYAPASVEIDFQSLLPSDQTFDEQTLEVVAIGADGRPIAFDKAQKEADRWRVPYRLDRLYGSNAATLNVVLYDEQTQFFAVYFDTTDSGRGRGDRYPGLIGDGDFFRLARQRREIAASHFDQFVDFDADGDLDLFQGGVEPYVYCYENMGQNRLVARGRLASGGKLFTLPATSANRSWLTVSFFDVDGDGDQDFFPSFNDGPDRGQIIFYRNTTARGRPLTFERVAPLRTASEIPLAGGPQAGGWFPSITWVKGWDGNASGRLDALVGSNNRCWLYRGRGTHAEGSPSFDDPVAVSAGGQPISLVNPRFDVGDVDADGDLDLVAGTQPGPIWLFENRGTRREPALATGHVVALDGKYLIGDAHSAAKLADFDGDGRLDVVAGRFWQRAELNRPADSPDFRGFYRNAGSPKSSRFARQSGGPYTEAFQPCDAVRQNCVRATDWDCDGRVDLLAGDTDGFVWFFRNETGGQSPIFANGKKVMAGDQPLCVASTGGHARPDVCDWNNDGAFDLVVADGGGTMTLFVGDAKKPGTLAAGQKILANGKPIQHGGRASVLVCDWNSDGRKDLVAADERGYYWHESVRDANPVLQAAKPILFGGRTVNYVRPNLGSFVDWDGDGRKDLIACEFENNVRFYKNLGDGAPGAAPRFADPEGTVILTASSPQMISGVHAIDFSGDGDLDLLTGQGHGGSNLRYYERDWIENKLHDTHPKLSAGPLEKRP
jgi:hypothetical protein